MSTSVYNVDFLWKIYFPFCFLFGKYILRLLHFTEKIGKYSL